MGDFCVSGFHSHLPIHDGDKAVAFICKHNNEPLSNCPCYLQGVLTPICMPVVGYMGDYGGFYEDGYCEENETTRLLKEITSEEFEDISEKLSRMSNFRTDDKDYPEFFKKFNEFSHSEDGTRYHMIYEHYDVYKAMTFEWNYVSDAIDSFIIPMKKILTDAGYNMVVNPFDDLLQYGLYSGMMDSIGYRDRNPGLMDELFKKKVRNAFDVQNEIRKLYKECSKDEHFYPPFKILWNYKSNDMSLLSLYSAAQLDFEKAKDDIVEMCSFMMQMDNVEYGHFYLSTAAGQSWHHDSDMWEERLKMLKVYENIIREKMK